MDESSGDKLMSLRDLRAGLESFVSAHGKLDLVGWDACLMASFETAQALAPVTHILVASEELEPGRGWNYDQLSQALVDKPASTGYDLGRAIIDAFTIHFTFYITAKGQPHPSGQLLYAFANTSQGPLQIPILPGDSVVPVYTRLTEKGAVADARHKYVLPIDKPTDFSVGWGIVGKGAYSLGFEVVNLAGIPAIEMEDFTLE